MRPSSAPGVCSAAGATGKRTICSRVEVALGETTAGVDAEEEHHEEPGGGAHQHSRDLEATQLEPMTCPLPGHAFPSSSHASRAR